MSKVLFRVYGSTGHPKPAISSLISVHDSLYQGASFIYFTIVSNLFYLFYSRASHITGHIDVEISEDLSEGSINFPGFSYESLDRRGNNPIATN